VDNELFRLSQADLNDIETVQKWIDLGADVNEWRSCLPAITPLMNAVQRNSSAEVVELLVSRGADLDARDSNGRTPLMHAASYAQNADAIARLIHLGADLDAEDNHGMTPLMCAASYNKNVDVVERFLKLVADSLPYYGERYDDWHASNNNPYRCYDNPYNWSGDRSPEMERRGVDDGDEGWRQLVSLAWHLEKRDKFGKTLLMYAAENNQNPDIIELLINYGADPNAYTGIYHLRECDYSYLDGNYLTPLIYAVKSNPNPDVVEMLVKLGARVDDHTDEDGMTPLMYAVKSNPNTDIIQRLVELGADLNARTIAPCEDICPPDAVTALHFAPLEAAKMLIKLGADLDSRDFYGRTPLMYMMKVGDRERAELLLEAGADVNAQDDCGATCLMQVAEAEYPKRNSELCLELNIELAMLLLDAGADVNAQDALMYAADADIAQLFLDAGADVNARDAIGRTPLMYAADPWVVRLLIKHGADLNMCDQYGLTAVGCALERSSNFDVIEELVNSGDDLSPEVADVIKKIKSKRRV